MSAPFIEAAIFPTEISNGSTGGPTFLTFVQSAQSGYEQRIQAWPYGRHYYEVQYGVKTPAQGYALLKFFHAMKGKTYGFRYKDPFDWKSTEDMDQTVSNLDITLITSAVGGETTQQIFKQYNEGGQVTTRAIKKPISGTVVLAINGSPKVETTDYTIDYTTGIITFNSALTEADTVTCGFHFHVPCRFDNDRLPMSLTGPLISNTNISVIEIRI